MIRISKVIDKVNQEIAALKLQLETLEIRIMIASDKVLQSIVNEVDDMGDIRLIDTKIKLIGS
jgi:rRNA maturation endonuclease Nob1